MAAYDFSNINEFVDRDGLAWGAIVKGMQSADIWTTYPGIDKLEVPVISDTMYTLSDGELPLSMDTGGTVFKMMTLDPINVGTVRGYGASQFNKYFGQFQSSPQLEQGLPFEAFLYDYITANFMTSYEDKMWNDSTKGIVALLYAASADTTNITYTAITAANGVTVVNKYWTSKPAALAMEKCELYVSATDFENYILALQSANLFDPATFASNVKGNSYKVPGTAGNLTIYGFQVLNTKNKAFLTKAGNFGWRYGSPMDFNNTQQFQYDLNSDKLVYRIKTKMAVGVHVPAEVLRAV